MIKPLSRLLLLGALSISSLSVSAEDTFRVCADPQNPPLSDKQEHGIENKIAKMFADELGQKLEYTWFTQRIGFIRNTLKAKSPDNPDQYKCDVVMGVPTGYELTSTTKTYYRSQYVLVIAKDRGWDDIKSSEDIPKLADERLDKLKFAMFDRGPGTRWLHHYGLLEQGVPHQSMTGDATVNVAMTMNRDLKNGTIDMAILWGPTAGYVISSSAKDAYTVIPMPLTPKMKFDFPISMGVRRGDKARLEQLNTLIDKKTADIQALILLHNVPLLDDKGQLISPK